MESLEWLAISAAMGFTLLPLPLLIVGEALGGFPPSVLYLLVAAITLSNLTILKVKQLPILTFRKSDALLISIVGVHFLVLALYFLVYPIFPPELYIHDYLVHLSSTSSSSGFLGGMTNSLYGVTQLASYSLIAFGAAVDPQSSLQSMRYSMTLMEAVVPFLVYFVAKRLTGKSRSALFSTVAYCFVFSLWGAGLLYTGLYGQFYGGLVALLSVWVAIGCLEKRVSFLLLALTVLTLVLSHPTSLLLLGVIPLSISINGLAHRRFSREMAGVAVLFTLPLAAGLALVGPSGLSNFLAGIESPQGYAVSSNTQLDQFVSQFPFLLVPASGGVLLLVLTVSTIVVALIRIRKVVVDQFALIVLIWFVTPWFLSFTAQGLHAMSRYAILDTVPNTIVLGLSYSWLIEPLNGKVSRKWKSFGSSFLYTAVAILLLVSTFQGATGNVLGDVTSQAAPIMIKQSDVYASMLWIEGNTPAKSTVISVGLPWYQFTRYTTNISYSDDYLVLPPEMTQMLSARTASSSSGQTQQIYVVLFSWLHGNGTSWYKAYSSDANYQLVWNSTAVSIFLFKSQTS